MLILQERLSHVPIVSLQTGAPIAETDEFIIDPRQLKVVAFYCKGPRLDVNPAILNVADIREFASVGLIVDSADVIMSPDDLVRLQEVIDFHFVLIDKHVVDTKGHKLGQVTNFALDSTTLYVVKLHVRPSLMKSWGTAELLIDRKQIVEVTDSKVVVQDTSEHEEEDAKVAKPLLENPFRRRSAQPESSVTDSRIETE